MKPVVSKFCRCPCHHLPVPTVRHCHASTHQHAELEEWHAVEQASRLALACSVEKKLAPSRAIAYVTCLLSLSTSGIAKRCLTDDLFCCSIQSSDQTEEATCTCRAGGPGVEAEGWGRGDSALTPVAEQEVGPVACACSSALFARQRCYI